MSLRTNPSEEPVTNPTTAFSIDETIRGVRYAGTFVYKVPTIADMIRIGQLKNQYLPNGSAADGTSALLVEQICYLEVTLQEPRPVWWKPLEFTEGDLIAQLYARSLAYANSFLGRAQDGRAANGADEIEDSGRNDFGNEGDVEQDLQRTDKRSKTVIAHTSRTK